MHVADRVEVDQGADAGDDHRHLQPFDHAGEAFERGEEVLPERIGQGQHDQVELGVDPVDVGLVHAPALRAEGVDGQLGVGGDQRAVDRVLEEQVAGVGRDRPDPAVGVCRLQAHGLVRGASGPDQDASWHGGSAFLVRVPLRGLAGTTPDSSGWF